MADAAIVCVHGERVGTLKRLSDYYDFTFEFDAQWLTNPQRPVLGQLFEDRRPRPIQTSGFPAWFDHLLPQGPARRLLQTWAGLDGEDNDDFDLLMAIGRDLPGAVSLEPAQWQVGRIHHAVGRRMRVLGSAPQFSLAGAQIKLSLHDGDKGLVLATENGAGHFIAKFEDPRYPGLPALEAATTRWAQRAAIDVHEIRLGEVDEIVDIPAQLSQSEAVLYCRRFDRSPEGAIHMEDFGQIMDVPAGQRQYSRSYEELARVYAYLCPNEIEKLLKRLAFMLVSGNGDAHLKNWSLIYPDRRSPSLAPAYDLISTICRIRNETLALSLNGQRDFYGVDRRAFEGLAQALGLGAEALGLKMQRWAQFYAEIWVQYRRELGFSESEQGKIDAHLKKLPLLAPALASGAKGVP